jgi:hypothetical protein
VLLGWFDLYRSREPDLEGLLEAERWRSGEGLFNVSTVVDLFMVLITFWVPLSWKVEEQGLMF